MTRHPVPDQSALERGPGRTGGGEQPAGTSHDHLGIRPHVHQHHHTILGRQVHRHKVGRGIRPHVARDQRHPVDLRPRIGAHAEAPGTLQQGGRLALAVQTGALHQGLVRSLADALHIQPEEEVAHRGVSRHDDLIDLLAGKPQTICQFENLVIDRIDDRLPQLALKLPVVGDAVHHVAAAETLRVLKRTHVDALSRFQVHEIHHDRCRAQIDRDAVKAAAIPVDGDAVIIYDVPPARDQGVRIDRLFQCSG